MFRLPTPRLLSGLKSALRPAMPRFKVSAFWLLILAWIFLLVWIWWKGPMWTLYEEQWLKPLANRWLATAAWGIIALVWLTVRGMKRLQQLEKMQKQQREEAGTRCHTGLWRLGRPQPSGRYGTVPGTTYRALCGTDLSATAGATLPALAV